ncbi:ATP-binding protein [Streptomyces sp. NPDC090108]|uniref:ATP-binding protein n=1 Tax=Streptomyces sp. NPDC090108 TaxID=3365947 RepID=UPI0038254B7E
MQGTRAAWEASGAPGTPGAPVVRDGRDTRNGIPAAPGDRGTPEPVAAAATTASAAAAASSAATATVRLEVADTSSRAPVPRCAGGEATGGRGLALVDCLADRWGWSPEGAGKSIWCELDRCPGGREGAETAYGSGTAAFEGLAFEAV